MSFLLLIDVGNTFVKWGRYRRPEAAPAGPAHDALLDFGRVLHDEIPTLTREWRHQQQPSLAVISNVAGTRIRNPLLRALEVWGPDAVPAHWITSQAEQCGVRNGYLNPGQLGSDRWAAMIGARALHGERAVLVAVCGTATTMDLVTARGQFMGGAIMPGLGLMQRVLHEQTAALPDAQGEYVDYPRQTVDAIHTGCVHAQAGAVERFFHQHRGDHPDLHCVISGGAARTLSPRLTIDFSLHENLVLEGLYQIAATLAS